MDRKSNTKPCSTPFSQNMCVHIYLLRYFPVEILLTGSDVSYKSSLGASVERERERGREYLIVLIRPV